MQNSFFETQFLYYTRWFMVIASLAMGLGTILLNRK